MAYGCNELLERGNYGMLPVKFGRALRGIDEATRGGGNTDEPLHRFLADLTSFRDNQISRYIPDAADPEAASVEVRDLVVGRLGKVADVYAGNGFQFDRERVMGRVGSVIKQNDGTQTDKGPADPGVDTRSESFSEINSKFAEHIHSALGNDNSEAVNRLMHWFGRRVAATCVYDRTSRIQTTDNDTLNRNIWRDRAAMFRDMVRYLKSVHPENGDVAALSENLFEGVTARPEEISLRDMDEHGTGTFNFHMAAALFEKLVVGDGKFRDKYAADSRASAREQAVLRRAEAYGEIVAWLRANGSGMYRAMVARGAERGRWDAGKFGSRAYRGSVPTYEARALLDFLSGERGAADRKALSDALGRDPVETMGEVMLYDRSAFMNVVDGYFALMHYDELLNEHLRDVIKMDGDGGRMYKHGRYRIDTGGHGNRPDYNESENMDALRYTTNFVRTILGMFDVYDYYNKDRFMNEQLQPKTLMEAFTKLRQGLQQGRIYLDLEDYRPVEGGGEEVKSYMLRRWFRERLDGLVYGPTEDIRWVLDHLFTTNDRRYGDRPLISRARLKYRGKPTERLTNHEVCVLKSFYDAVLNGSEPDSLVSVADGTQSYGAGEGRRIVDILCRYLMSNENVRYLTSRVGHDGRSSVYVEEGYSENFMGSRERQTINLHSNGIGTEAREELQRKYGFRVNMSEAGDGKLEWSVTLSDGSRVRIVTSGDFGIMYGDEATGKRSIDMTPDGMEGFWRLMSSADIESLTSDMVNGVTAPAQDGMLSTAEASKSALRAALEFVDDFLGTGFLTGGTKGMEVLQMYRDHYSEREETAGLENYMMPLIKMAMRGAYANLQYIGAAAQSKGLETYLSDSQDTLYDSWRNVVGRNGQLMHIGLSRSLGEMRYSVANGNDYAVLQLANARAIERGENSSGSFRGPDGKSFPTGTVRKAAVDPYMIAYRMGEGAKPIDAFGDVVGAIADITHGLTLVGGGDSKLFKEGTVKELLYDTLINRTLVPLSKTSTKTFNRNPSQPVILYMQPMSFSDKGQVPVLGMDVNRDSVKDNLFHYENTTRDGFFKAHGKTLGAAFRGVFNASRERLLRVMPYVAARLEEAGRADDAGRIRADVAKAEATLKQRASRLAAERAEYDANMDLVYGMLKLTDERTLLDAVEDYNADTRNKDRLRLQKNLDYRVVGDPHPKEGVRAGNVLVANELLRKYATVYTDRVEWEAEMERGARGMIRTLLRAGSHYTVLDSWDKLKWHTGEQEQTDRRLLSDNDIYRCVEWYAGYSRHYAPKGLEVEADSPEGRRTARRRRYYRDWVDEKTGQLILARQGGRAVRNVTDYVDVEGSQERFEINPMLEYVQLVYTLLARPMQTLYGGSELNCPIEGPKVFREALGLGAEGVAERAGVDAGRAAFIADALGGMSGVDELAVWLGRDGNAEKAGDGGAAWLRDLVRRSWFEASASAQKSNAKRFGAAVSTFQAGHQGLLEGAPAEIYVANYEDIVADCYNYSGERSRVKVYEGNTIMSPFMWRWANAMYGDHAGGEQEKSMLYSLDDGSLTYELFKHVAVAISNRTMLLTDRDEGIVQRDLFKKMSDIRWRNRGGASLGVDLTVNNLDPFVVGRDGKPNGGMPDALHVSRRIFGDRWLYYRGRNGRRVRIETLGRDWLRIVRNADGTTDAQVCGKGDSGAVMVYYTLEGDGLVRRGSVNVSDPASHPTEKVYHVFYDVPDGETSRHVRCHGAKEALEFIASHGKGAGDAHTIDSIYQLHKALGGIQCVDELGRQSESNLDVTHRFINYTVGRRPGAVVRGKLDYNQKNFRRPLAECLTAYLTPPSTEKKGPSNINPKETMRRGKDLIFARYKVSTANLGIQQDAGKDMEDEKLSLPTQLMSAAGMTGWNVDDVWELNEAIARRMEAAGKGLLDCVRRLVDGRVRGGREEIKDAIGRLYGVALKVFMDSGGGGRSGAKVAEKLKSMVRNESERHGKHLNDAVYMPFSSDVAYREFIDGLSNFITKKCINVKLKGAGCTIAPSYDMVKLYRLDIDGREMKLMPEDVVRSADREYREDLLRFLRGRPELVSGEDRLEGDAENLPPLGERETDELEAEALAIDPTGKFGAETSYYTAETDLDAVRDHMRRTFLERHRIKNAPELGANDRAWFMPGDVVDIYDGNGRLFDTVTLDINNYYGFLDGVGHPRNCTYRPNVTVATDLRPEIIRWRYRESPNGPLRWMNYFALDHVRGAMTDPERNDPHSDAYRETCRETMRQLSKGRFSLKGRTYKIEGGVEGIERHEAETVLSNIHPKEFGVMEGDTLHDVMRLGADYFRRFVQNSLRTPVDTAAYDIALLSNSGRHALVKFGRFEPDMTTTRERFSGEITDEHGEIWATAGLRRLFPVARWVDYKGGDVRIVDGRLESDSGEVNARCFKIGTDRNGLQVVQERVDLVRKYRTQIYTKDTSGRPRETEVTLYNIMDDGVFKKAYYGRTYDERETDIDKMRPAADRPLGRIISGIFSSGEYATAEICGPDRISNGQAGRVAVALEALASRSGVGDNVEELLSYQSDMLKDMLREDGGRTGKWSWEGYGRLKEAWYDSLAQERFACFQDSLKVISGRIPTTGLQSFMNMETVGWTGGRTNTAYVSHFQIYLQGSDFDADKANVIAQAYDFNGRYVGWSPYFDMSSLRTLEESKRLPVMENLIMRADGEKDISREAKEMMLSSSIDRRTGRLTVRGKGEADRIRFLRALARALRRIMRTKDAKGVAHYRLEFGTPEQAAAIRHTLERCGNNEIDAHRLNDALNNIMQAKIWGVLSDVRNILAATTPVQTTKHVEAASRTPKALEEVGIEDSNPFSTIERMVRAQGAKKGVSIGASAMKFQERAYQYVMQALSGGDAGAAARTLFHFEVDGIKGRAKGMASVEKAVVERIPDINVLYERDGEERVKGMLRGLLGNGWDPDAEVSKDVVNNLSEFVNVETDDEKLGISSNLNITQKTAPLYTAMYFLGFDVDDTVAFMTSPYADEIVRALETNVFGGDAKYINIRMAIDRAVGKIPADGYMHGNYRYTGDELNEMRNAAEGGERVDYTKKGRIVRLLKSNLNNGGKKLNAVLNRMEEILDGERDGVKFGKRDLDDLIMAFALASAERTSTDSSDGSPLLLSDVIGVQTERETARYVAAVDEAVLRVRAAALKYTSEGEKSGRCRDGVAALLSDRVSMRRIGWMADEMKNATTTFLALNGGITFGDAKTLSALNSMEKAYRKAEKRVGLSAKRYMVAGVDGKIDDTARKYAGDVVARIMEKGTRLTEAQVRERLDAAKANGIMGNFDIMRAMSDPDYRAMAIEYMEALKVAVNTLDMVYSHPDYRVDMGYMHAYEETTRTLSMRKRLLVSLLRNEEYVDDEKVRRMEGVASRIIGNDYLSKRKMNVTLKTSDADGFSEMWDKVRVSSFDLSMDSGQGGFCNWVKGDFRSMLMKEYGTNPLVANLVLGDNNAGREVLKPSGDMLDIDRNASTRFTFDAMVDGFKRLSGVKFKHNNDLTLGDILFLYDLVENGHRATRTSLTTIINEAGLKEGLAADYRRWVSEMDRTEGYVPYYDAADVDMMLAPTVDSENRLNHMTDPYVVLIDDQGGFEMRKYDKETNSYSNTSVNAFIEDRTADSDLKRTRLLNYLTSSPLRMPRRMESRRSWRVIAADVPDRDSVRRVLVNYSLSGMSQFLIEC